MMVNPSEVSFWRSERSTDVMSHHDVVRHVAWVKAENPSLSLEDIGKPLTIKRGRTQEIMANPDTRLGYAYRLRVTAAARRMYPDGVPMIEEFRVAGDSPEEALDRAFGPRSVPAHQQRLIPAPEPIVVRDSDLGKHDILESLEGDGDFNPEDESLTMDDAMAYIHRLEVRLRQKEQQNLHLDQVITGMRKTEADLRASLRDVSNMNADNDKLLKEVHEVAKRMEKDLEEAQEYIRGYHNLRTVLRGILSDE